VARTDSGSFDVLGLLQAEPGGNVQVFRVREGALVERQTFYIENAAGREAQAVLEEFMLEYYWRPEAIPAQIIAPLDQGGESVAALLAARRGARVQVRRAQRGPKRRLQALAHHNAELAGQAEAHRLHDRSASRIGALERLRTVLGLVELPLRIECYDISNLGERHPVGSMVVFEGGLPKKAHYRKFAVRSVAGQDDVAMMREVVGRRLERYVAACADPEEPFDESFAKLPGLIVVDGGKGQLSAAGRALRASGVGVPIIALAKQREEVFVPGRPAPLALAADDPASLLLQRVRDEAHRFAVTFHRQRRGGDLKRATIFDELPKIGPTRRRRILEHFGSPERFVSATREELAGVPGLPPKVAREIYAHLHKAG
jgi:excinuclease ABC subunit C